MKLHAPRRHQRDESVIPLISIVFLLLIFFMLTGKLTSPDLFEITPPTSTGVDIPASSALLLLMSADGRLAVDDRALADDELRQLIAARLAAEKDLQVNLNADARVQAHRLIAVMEILRETGIQKLNLLAVAPDE
jgi:biopolymer transport protein ExbD